LKAWALHSTEVQIQIYKSKLDRDEADRMALEGSAGKPLLHQENMANSGIIWGGRVIGMNKLGRVWEEVRGKKRKREEIAIAENDTND